MATTVRATTWGRGQVIAAVAALLALSNVVSTLYLTGWAYVPWNLAIAALVLLLGSKVLSLHDMGFTNWRTGAAWGGVLFAVTSVVLSVAILLPVFDELFRDRIAGESAWKWGYVALIRIPFGTVLLEEVAFRAVLPALFSRRVGVVAGSVVASLCFALWRVLPVLHSDSSHNTIERWLGQGAVGTTAGLIWAMVGTFVGGLCWCFVRYRSGSVLASFIGHLATSSMAYTIAFAITR